MPLLLAPNEPISKPRNLLLRVILGEVSNAAALVKCKFNGIEMKDVLGRWGCAVDYGTRYIGSFLNKTETTDIVDCVRGLDRRYRGDREVHVRGRAASMLRPIRKHALPYHANSCGTFTRAAFQQRKTVYHHAFEPSRRSGLLHQESSIRSVDCCASCGMMHRDTSSPWRKVPSTWAA
jgi:hypothetical protein